MVDKISWQRARQPEQKQERRGAILDAAEELFVSGSIAELTLAGIAERAGLAKASVYSYFATKEEVLLGVLSRELEPFFEEVDRLLTSPAARPRTSEQVARALCTAVARRPLLCRLLARLFIDIEQNLSMPAAEAFKRALLERLLITGGHLEAALPRLPHRAGGRFLLQWSALIAGLWPMAHPTGPIHEVLSRREMAPLRIDFRQELGRATAALLAGLAGPQSPKKKAKKENA